MSTTTTSYSTTQSHKQRSSISSHHHINNHYKAPETCFGKWKRRPNRSQTRISPQDQREAQELLRSLLTKKDFSLPSSLPAWNSPSQLSAKITPDLRWYRDYSEVRRPTTTTPASNLPSLPSTVQASDESNAADGGDAMSIDEEPKPPAPSFKPSTEPSTTRKDDRSNRPRKSTSPDQHRSQDQRYPTNQDTFHRPTESVSSFSSSLAQTSDKPLNEPHRTITSVNGKGKEKLDDHLSTIDWSDWKHHTYSTKSIGDLRSKYSNVARDLKRSSERQMRDYHLSLKPSSTNHHIREKDAQVAVIEMVDSLLLFTQSFLCQDLELPPSHVRKVEYHKQWESMVGFMNSVKSTAKRSGIDLAYAICLMYESILLHRLVEAQRPHLLSEFGHHPPDSPDQPTSSYPSPEKQIEGFKQFKTLLSRQEIAKQSYQAAQTIFDRLFDIEKNSTSRSNSPLSDNKFRTLPRLKNLTQQMRPRINGQSPEIMSMDGKPSWRFCWPIDRFNHGSLADFVVFARAGLEEWLDGSGSGYRLERFDDHDGLFPSTSSSSHKTS